MQSLSRLSFKNGISDGINQAMDSFWMSVVHQWEYFVLIRFKRALSRRRLRQCHISFGAPKFLSTFLSETIMQFYAVHLFFIDLFNLYTQETLSLPKFLMLYIQGTFSKNCGGIGSWPTFASLSFFRVLSIHYAQPPVSEPAMGQDWVFLSQKSKFCFYCSFCICFRYCCFQ